MPAKKKQNPFALIVPLLEDPEVTEIMIDGTERITIERRGRFEDAKVRFHSDDDIRALVRESLKMAGRELDEDKTVYDVRFDDNSRMIAVLEPTSIHGHSVIFRKWMRTQISWQELLETRCIPAEARDSIQSALHARASILVAGGAASGKTTLTNRIVELIPPEKRVVTVEQTHEFQFEHPRAVFLEADGTIPVAMEDLLTAGAKLRPDWMVIGELRGAEAFRAVQLMGSGNPAISTLHATSVENALTRLEAMCLMANLGLGLDDIRELIVAALRLILYQEHLPNGKRKMLQMTELNGLEHGHYILKPLMRYDAEQDRFDMTGVKPGWEK
jgi:Flp pilus assembly protein, ATPase CpaF